MVGTNTRTSISDGSPQDYGSSRTSERRNTSHFQELATLSTQPGPSPNLHCSHCCCCNRGHDRPLSPALKHLVSELVEQTLDQYGLRHLRQTTERTWTLLDDQQQVLHQHQQQLTLNKHELQQVLHQHQQQQALNKHKQQQVHGEGKEQHVLSDHKQQQVYNEHQLLVLHEPQEQQVHNEHMQQLVLHERKEQEVYNEHQLLILHEPKEQEVNNEHELLILHEPREQEVNNEHELLILHEPKEQEVNNEHQLLILHERKEQPEDHKHQQHQDDQESQSIRREGQYGRSLPDMKDAISENPRIEVVKKKQPPSGTGVTAKPPVSYGGSALWKNYLTPTTYHGVYDQGSARNCRPLGGGNSAENSSPISESPRRARERERPSGIIPRTTKLSKVAGRGTSHDFDKHHDSSNTEKAQSRVTHSGKRESMEKAELMTIVTDLEMSSTHVLRKELKQLRAQLQEFHTKSHSSVLSHDSRVSSLTTTIAEYKAIADNIIAIVDNHCGVAGAHKNSHATPPTLVRCREVVNQAVVAFTKTFIAFLKERNAFESHVAVISVPDERDRKHAVQAYICSRLFAGFENDCYMDDLDHIRSSKYLPAKYEETQFFLRNQNPEFRYKQYVAEYESVRELGVEGIMSTLKNLDTFKEMEKEANAPFFQFCCRKLVSIMNDVDNFAKEFPPSRDYSQRFLLHQLATNSVYCGFRFLKPFVKLAMAAFLLHRLAFQFHPPARIFRYASGTPFDATYMRHPGPIDDEDSDEEFVVGFMLIPGFQVGATTIKCIVSSVPSSTVTTRWPL